MRHTPILYRRLLLLALIVVAPIVGGGCGCGPHLPAQTSPEYSQIVSTFTVGTVALETDDPDHKVTFLTKMTQMAPDEPAGWANLGLLQIRNNQLTEAAASLAKARDLAPPTAGIEKLLGLLADRTGNLSDSIAHYRKAVELAPNDLRARYSLAQQLARLSTPEADTESQAALQGILKQQPYNLLAQVELARIAAKRGDLPALRETLALLESRSSTFAPDAIERLKAVRQAVGKSDSHGATLETTFLENVLKQNPAFAPSSSALTKPQGLPGDPINQFIKLPPMPALCAPPDLAVSFSSEPLTTHAATGKTAYAGAFWLDNDGHLALAVSDGRSVHLDNGAILAFPGGPGATPPGPHGVVPIEMNYDLRNDLVLAGQGGLRFCLQTGQGTFTDVTAQTKLPAALLSGRYTGAWAVDIEADGDLDIVLGTPDGPPLVLVDNGDGTWGTSHPFAAVSGVRDFAWADLDLDGSTDATLIDGTGALHVFANLRSGLFRERPLPPDAGKFAALAVADVDNDGKMDVVGLRTDGSLVRISDRDQGTRLEVVPIAQWSGAPPDLAAGKARLLTGDLDNNGAVDLVASTDTAAQAWLCDEKRAYAPLSAPIAGSVTAIADTNGDGRLDLIGLSPQGEPVRFINKGLKSYRWQEVRPRAQDAEIVHGDQKKPTGENRVNSFGVGGEIETRAGLLYQKQPMDGPVIHSGLGNYTEADVARVVWPNGDVRSEFSHLSNQPLKPNGSISIEHRLNSSCPWVFAWNGHDMGFVTDFIWRSPVGLRINAQATAGMEQTEDRIKIAGDQLVPRDGYYDVRITAELWETHFFDSVRLMTVDHPIGDDVFVDERFAIPPPKLDLHTLTPPRPVARAVDDNGADVTDTVRALDGRYLDTFGRGDYQGITRDHYVEFEVPANSPHAGPLYLVASGWIHPTDSSINVAISQGKHDQPRGLSLEVPDGKGGWRTAKANLGFPAGKTKTILIRLDDVLPGPNGSRVPNTEHPPVSRHPEGTRAETRSQYPTPNTQYQNRKFRLRTNLEIYWDRLATASEVPHPEIHTRVLAPETAELRYRGFSETSQANASSPVLPDYTHLAGTTQRWRDLIGYCTRFGDVRELLGAVDDRYVIMNAGDELALRFPVPPPPRAGWKRDFILIGDGWEKDGNLNTAFSKTILPLPFHGQKSYNTPPGRLEDDPVVRRHPADWQNYHTRYITPEAFQDALRPGSP